MPSSNAHPMVHFPHLPDSVPRLVSREKRPSRVLRLTVAHGHFGRLVLGRGCRVQTLPGHMHHGPIRAQSCPANISVYCTVAFHLLLGAISFQVAQASRSWARLIIWSGDQTRSHVPVICCPKSRWQWRIELPRAPSYGYDMETCVD